MIDMTTDNSALDAWESEGGPQFDEAQRIFRDRSRYQSREIEHVLGSLVPAAAKDRACHLMRSEPRADDVDDSIVRGID